MIEATEPVRLAGSVRSRSCQGDLPDEMLKELRERAAEKAAS